MWKENDEYEAASPAVQAHFHALRAEDALRREDFVAAEREGRLASDKFAQAAEHVASKRTVDALLLLADNYEYRAKVARSRLPPAASPTKTPPSSEGKLGAANDASSAQTRSRSASRNGRDRGDVDNADAAQPGSAAGGASKAAANAVSRTHTHSQRPANGGDGSTHAPDPAAGAAAETQLNLAAAEMEELWRRLQEIGLSSTGSSDKTNNVLMASRHLSSSLGDSFCLLPAKTKTSGSVLGTAIDGGSTLRAAVASRMRNQRLRLMEQQFGARGIIDDRFHKSPGRTPSAASAGIASNGGGGEYAAALERRHTVGGGAGSGAGGGVGVGGAPAPSAAEVEGLHETIAQQKLEIVRLLNTVKSLSSENTKLLKKCETLTNVQDENREIHESMEKFKGHYNQKLVMIKRALEEWRRQRNSAAPSSTTAASSHPPPPPTSSAAEQQQRVAELEQQLAQQQQQLAQLSDAVKSKDEQLAKYEKWYRTLKEGAKAKQRSQALSSSGAGGAGGGGAQPVPRDSFTSSSSFHDYSGAVGGANGGSSSSGAFGAEAPSGRPPAHPTRRAL